MSELEILTGTEVARKRPGMYIGSTGPRGIAHLLWEVVGNTIDEHLAGHADRLDVHWAPDGSWRVADDGRGIDPTRFETVFCTLHAGPTLDGHLPHIHVGHAGRGVGVGAVCALSSWMRVESRWEGGIWQQFYVQGESAGELTRVGSCTDTGTAITYLPDLDIFTHKREEHPRPKDLARRIRELAALAPRLQFCVQGVDYTSPDGLATLTEARAGAELSSPTTFTTRAVVDDIDIDVAVTWGDGEPSNQLFVNFVDIMDTAPKLTRMLASTRTAGRHAVVSILMLNPRFAGPTRNSLDSPEAIRAIRKVIKGALPGFLANELRYRNPAA